MVVDSFTRRTLRSVRRTVARLRSPVRIRWPRLRGWLTSAADQLVVLDWPNSTAPSLVRRTLLVLGPSAVWASRRAGEKMRGKIAGRTARDRFKRGRLNMEVLGCFKNKAW